MSHLSHKTQEIVKENNYKGKKEKIEWTQHKMERCIYVIFFVKHLNICRFIKHTDSLYIYIQVI